MTYVQRIARLLAEAGEKPMTSPEICEALEGPGPHTQRVRGRYNSTLLHMWSHGLVDRTRQRGRGIDGRELRHQWHYTFRKHPSGTSGP
ncbi:MAG: hypothetical protein OXT72_10445 [Gammaproteobacteria bacterium]|nr:hypothetical protein [Gammaproteobacteria bacterium]MDE0246926.1 hypothetical protein [Gammaproteobacteria bacterium]